MGRNVNQIAKHLNSAFYESDKVNLDALGKLPSVLEVVRRVVHTLIKTSKQGWRADEE
ncbi:hypothetical protein [Pseudomonas sp. JG-B]|uniref:hypothetical protein n=1 Tax=Pseudomonas sp. JG-B TaxID=2603214 RepID=UPI003557BBE1